MKKLIATLLAALALHAQAEVITIKSPYGAQHAGHAALYKIMEKANTAQTQYNFMLELKPGGNGVLALNSCWLCTEHYGQFAERNRLCSGYGSWRRLLVCGKQPGQ
jgi:hypothetical protein